MGANNVDMIKVRPDSGNKDLVSDVVQGDGPAMKVPIGILGQQAQGRFFSLSAVSNRD